MEVALDVDVGALDDLADLEEGLDLAPLTEKIADRAIDDQVMTRLRRHDGRRGDFVRSISGP